LNAGDLKTRNFQIFSVFLTYGTVQQPNRNIISAFGNAGQNLKHLLVRFFGMDSEVIADFLCQPAFGGQVALGVCENLALKHRNYYHDG
jgi:hypothetical protein